MADIRSSQSVAQVEWQEPGAIKVSQTVAQVEYVEGVAGWAGKINGVTNPAKINGIAVANIASVMGQ